MPRYRYTAVDPQGNELTGEREAADPGALRALLAAEHACLIVCTEDDAAEPLAAVPDACPAADVAWHLPAGVLTGNRLSVDEAAELAAQLAEVAKSELPLPAGLRALADELPRGWFGPSRLSRLMRAMARQLESGASLEETLRSHAGRLPPSVFGLLLAGIRSERLAEGLDEFVLLQREQIDLRARVRGVMAYPLFLLGSSAALFGVVLTAIVPQFERIFKDFDAELPTITQAVISFSHHYPYYLLAAAAMIGLVAAVGCLSTGWSLRMWDAVPMIGPMYRWRRMVSWTRWMAMLLDQHLALPDALRLAADGVNTADVRYACEGLARQVESGGSLSESLPRYRRLPATLGPLVAWGERNRAMGAAFRAAAEMYEVRTRTHFQLFEALLPVVVFVTILGCVGFTVLALFMPLICLIQKLT
jgi:type II secretory pathway component PulF